MFSNLLSIFGALGGLAGFLTLGWRLLETRNAYLHIVLTVETRDGHRMKLRTIVENRNSIARKLDSAFLLIGPAAEDPDKTMVALFKANNEPHNPDTSNELVRVVTNRLKHNTSQLQDDAGRMIIPLPFYFKENYDIADEELSYEHIIDCDQFPQGMYSARFYIEGIPRLHRLVQAAFEVDR
jgi:hypothetical protein